jgi:hypothetical protein
MNGRLKTLSGGIARAARFAAREPLSALLLLRMAAWVAATSLLLKVMPFGRAMVLITPLRRRRAPAHDPAETQARLSRLIDLLLAADFWLYTPTCWKRAPVLYRFLALNGISTRVVFGVRRKQTGALDGHAWLEADGEPLLERTAPDYKITFSYPA